MILTKPCTRRKKQHGGEENKSLVEVYSEDDLKINFIAPILSNVKFKSYDKKIRAFYELSMSYQTNPFKLSGTVDFVVSEGLVESKKPSFDSRI